MQKNHLLTRTDQTMRAFDSLRERDRALWLLTDLDVVAQAYAGLKERNLLTDSKCAIICLATSLLRDEPAETTQSTLTLMSRALSLILLHDVAENTLVDIGLPASAIARAKLLTHKITITQDDHDYLRRSGTAITARFLFHGMQKWVA